MKRYALGIYEKAFPAGCSWRKRLSLAKNAGYDYMKICIDATKERIDRIYMDGAGRLEIIRLMKEISLPIRSMSVSALTRYSLGNEEEALRRQGMEIAKKAMELADDLGIHMVMIPGYDVYFSESTYSSKHLFRENLEAVIEYAAKRGITVAFETMENEFMNTVEKAMKYILLFKRGYLQIYPDLGNLTNAACLYRHDLYEDMELGRGHIMALHLKETLPGIFREVPFGKGHVDFQRGIEKAWELDVRRFVTEFWYTGNPEWEKDIYYAGEHFTGLLNRVAGSRKEKRQGPFG